MNIIIMGGAGFIGSHLAKKLKEEGNWVRVVDIERNQYMPEHEFCNEFIQVDLRDPIQVANVIPEHIDEIYQMAALMGGAGFIFTGENDADIMYSSAIINLNIANECIKKKVKRIFYSSSACIYNQELQTGYVGVSLKENMAWPLNPDSDYGVEKGFSERLYQAFAKNKGLDIKIARFHNIFGQQGSWNNGKEKSPAAICRKVAQAVNGSNIDVWGTGEAVRSFLYIDECIEGILRLMRSDCKEIVNIGSDEMITINDLAKMVIRISGKNLTINNISGPTGVRGRNSQNDLIYKELGWKPTRPLEEGIRVTYDWITSQVNKIT